MMSHRKIFTSVLTVISALALAGCSTAIDGSTQQISFKTVGADDARCTITIGANQYNYEVNPPQSIWIQKSRKPMFVNCTAQGNRTQDMTVMSKTSGWTIANTLNGGLGLAIDGTSGAMYTYPDEVVIDFSAVAAKDQYLPAYENYGALDPKAQGIEDMGPETPALSTDAAISKRYQAAYEEADRLEAEQAAIEAEKQRRIDSLDGGFYGDKTGGYSTKKNLPATGKGGAEMELIPYDGASAITPATKAAPAIASAPSSVSPEEVVVPSAPQLGRPLFPSTTSF